MSFLRPLTVGEVDLLEEAFRGRIDPGMVRLVDGHDDNPVARAAFRNGNTAITLRKTVYFGAHYRTDFAGADPRVCGLFVHEMTHVWQYSQLGIAPFFLRYGRELASCRFNARAMYRYTEGETPFGKARLEAQAQMVGDYCHSRLVGDSARMDRLARNLESSGFYGL